MIDAIVSAGSSDSLDLSSSAHASTSSSSCATHFRDTTLRPIRTLPSALIAPPLDTTRALEQGAQRNASLAVHAQRHAPSERLTHHRALHSPPADARPRGELLLRHATGRQPRLQFGGA
jgi:hypothetical protein